MGIAGGPDEVQTMHLRAGIDGFIFQAPADFLAEQGVDGF